MAQDYAMKEIAAQAGMSLATVDRVLHGRDGVSATTANNCSGSGSGTGYGLTAETANNCYGVASGSGGGLWAAEVATGCFGYSNTGTGLTAFIANGCRGTKPGGVSSLSVTHNVNSF